MKNHCNHVPYRNFVVKLAHFGLKRSNNYRNRGFNLLTFFKLVFTKANMKNHSKNFPNRNFVVKLAHFELQRSDNTRNEGLNLLKFF
jgi:hypothetical protein